MKSNEGEFFRMSTCRVLTYLAVEAILRPGLTDILPYSTIKQIKKLAPFGRKFMQSHDFEKTMHGLGALL